MLLVVFLSDKLLDEDINFTVLEIIEASGCD